MNRDSKTWLAPFIRRSTWSVVIRIISKMARFDFRKQYFIPVPCFFLHVAPFRFINFYVYVYILIYVCTSNLRIYYLLSSRSVKLLNHGPFFPPRWREDERERWRIRKGAKNISILCQKKPIFVQRFNKDKEVFGRCKSEFFLPFHKESLIKIVVQTAE